MTAGPEPGVGTAARTAPGAVRGNIRRTVRRPLPGGSRLGSTDAAGPVPASPGAISVSTGRIPASLGLPGPVPAGAIPAGAILAGAAATGVLGGREQPGRRAPRGLHPTCLWRARLLSRLPADRQLIRPRAG